MPSSRDGVCLPLSFLCFAGALRSAVAWDSQVANEFIAQSGRSSLFIMTPFRGEDGRAKHISIFSAFPDEEVGFSIRRSAYLL